MSPPLVLPPLHYDCLQCGLSCRTFDVELRPEEAARLSGRPHFLPLRQLDPERFFLPKHLDGSCLCLNQDTLCQIHLEQGHAAKPQTCKNFPFHRLATPGGVFVGASFLCTAIVRGHGRPLEEQRQELSAQFLSDSEEVAQQWLFWEDLSLDWGSYQSIEQHLSQRYRDNPLDGPILGAARLAYVLRHRQPAQLLGQECSPELDQAVLNLLRGLITLVETSGATPQRMQEVLEALYEGTSYESRALSARVELAALDRSIPDWFPEEMDRFLQHLLFRKTLLLEPGVFARACLLALIPGASLYFMRARAQILGRLPERDDFFHSLGILEGNLLCHARGLESYFVRCGQVFFERS